MILSISKEKFSPRPGFEPGSKALRPHALPTAPGTYESYSLKIDNIRSYDVVILKMKFSLIRFHQSQLY